VNRKGDNGENTNERYRDSAGDRGVNACLYEAGHGHTYESILLARFPLQTLKPEAVGDPLNPENQQPASR